VKSPMGFAGRLQVLVRSAYFLVTGTKPMAIIIGKNSSGRSSPAAPRLPRRI